MADDTPTTVDSYVASVPDTAKKHFEQLRAVVLEELPDAEEVISYGIIGYKVDEKRAVVYISGWKDHVALYPVPAEPDLLEELKPYIKGKGTLWFGLDAPLPEPLIRKIVRAHMTARSS